MKKLICALVKLVAALASNRAISSKISWLLIAAPFGKKASAKADAPVPQITQRDLPDT